MSKSAADKIYDATVDAILHGLNEDEEGKIDPRAVANAIKFLKDQGYEAAPAEGSPLAKLVDKLKPVGEDEMKLH